jgi:hypothetical protein
MNTNLIYFHIFKKKTFAKLFLYGNIFLSITSLKKGMDRMKAIALIGPVTTTSYELRFCPKVIE